MMISSYHRNGSVRWNPESVRKNLSPSDAKSIIYLLPSMKGCFPFAFKNVACTHADVIYERQRRRIGGGKELDQPVLFL
jgi:hypothetical protein